MHQRQSQSAIFNDGHENPCNELRSDKCSHRSDFFTLIFFRFYKLVQLIALPGYVKFSRFSLAFKYEDDKTCLGGCIYGAPVPGWQAARPPERCLMISCRHGFLFYLRVIYYHLSLLNLIFFLNRKLRDIYIYLNY